MSQVLKGIRILEVAEHTFVPAASAILADWGAEVVKIEHVERGDAMRGLASTGMRMFEGKVSVLMEHSNRGKKSLALDLGTAEGRDIVYRLAATSDVFLTNKMPGVRAKLQIDVDDIRAHNPDIVYVRGSGYGARGPDADAGGYDILGFWYRGTSAMSAKLDGADLPSMPGPAYGDSIGAMTIAGGIAAALLHRERTGEADVVDVSLLATGMWAMGAGIALSLRLGDALDQLPADMRTAPANPLVGNYVTADNRFVGFSMLQGFHYWKDACRALGLDDLADDERFSTLEGYAEHASVGAALIAARVVEHTLDEWKEKLHGFRGQWSPVQNTLDVARDPQVEANGYLQEVHSRDGEPFVLVSTPVQFNDEPAPVARGPEFNEHGDDILLHDLGYDWDAIIDLKVRNIVA